MRNQKGAASARGLQFLGKKPAKNRDKKNRVVKNIGGQTKNRVPLAGPQSKIKELGERARLQKEIRKREEPKHHDPKKNSTQEKADLVGNGKREQEGKNRPGFSTKAGNKNAYRTTRARPFRKDKLSRRKDKLTGGSKPTSGRL